MRHLSPSTHARARAGQRGLTLIELVVAFAITSLLALAAAPYLADFSTNSRLREAGNALYAEALFAQGEAIKRNRVVRVDTAGNVVTVSDMTVPTTPAVLRTRTLADGVVLPTSSFSFGSTGWPVGLASTSINVTHSVANCSSDTRCPGLRVEAGGAIRLCANHLSSC